MSAVPQSVLFLCGQNSIRSPIAETIIKYRFPGKVFADSAGIRDGNPDPFVEIILQENNLSKSAHEPKLVEALDDGYFDLIIALSPGAYERAKEIAAAQAIEAEYWEIGDPSLEDGSRERVLDAYRCVYKDIETRIDERFRSIETGLVK